GDGTPVFEAQAELPEGVSASIDESLGVSFAASARLDDDHVLVSWRFMRLRIRGIAPEPGESVVRQQASGVVRIDTRSGHVESSRTGEVPPEPELPETVARLVKSGELRGPVWRGGAVLAAIRERGDDTGPVIVSRWDRR